MKVSDKRGVSGVVTAVLLILLVIAAIGILWVVIQNFVEQGTSGVTGSADCLETGFEALSANSSATNVTVRRIAGDATLSNIRISVGSEAKNGVPIGYVSIGQSSTATGFTLNSGDNIDVKVAVTLLDDTGCPIINAGSVVVKP